MLRSVTLTNFKSFERETFPLAPLTLIMGENGAGKSSVIQSMLLVKQSITSNSFLEEGLSLNGELCSVGVGRDLLRQGANEEFIGIDFKTDTMPLKCEFVYDPESDRLPLRSEAPRLTELWDADFSYLSAERIGPRLTNPRLAAAANEKRLGVHGEGALAVLERYRAEILPDGDPRRRGQSGSLEEIFQSYLSEISSNARLDLQPYRGVDSIGSTFTFSIAGGIPGAPFRPTNVGFGLSYCLPIIVGCLVAQKGALLIIENPEAHLHTRGQRAMADLLSFTALAGVQVIVETHSREIFYSLRRAVIEKKIPADLGCLDYIEVEDTKDGERKSVCHNLPTLNADLKEWPSSFFAAFGSPTDLIMPR